MNKKDLFKKAVAEAGTEGANVQDTVLVSQEQYQGLKKEPRTKKAHTYMRKSEHEKFLSIIGRESFSDMSRELILLTMGQETEDPKKRNIILELLKSNNDFELKI